MKKSIRLTATEAARAASIDRKTLLSRLADAGQEPDSRNRYSLRQVVAGLCGGLADARRRHAAAQAELAEFELAKARGELLPAAEVRATWDAGFGRLRDAILNLALPRSDRHALLRSLHAVAIGDATAAESPVNTQEEHTES